MEIKRQIVESKTPPSNKEVWWFDVNDETIKRYKQGKWAAVLTQESTQESEKHKPAYAIVKYSTTDGSSVVSESAILNSTSEIIFPTTNIPSEVFSLNKTLYQVIIADATEIGEEAFYMCNSLTSITIPNSVTEIGDKAFATSKNLSRSIYISDLSIWCKIVFSSWDSNPCCYGAKLYLNGSELTDITIPSDITEIKAYAFIYCNSLTSVTIPDSVTSIGERAFQHCSSLTSVTIPDSVTEIKYNAFNGCASMKTIYCKSITPPTLSGEYTIPTDIDVIYVPIESVDAYKSATNWSRYRNLIVGYNF